MRGAHTEGSRRGIQRRGSATTSLMTLSSIEHISLIARAISVVAEEGARQNKRPDQATATWKQRQSFAVGRQESGRLQLIDTTFDHVASRIARIEGFRLKRVRS